MSEIINLIFPIISMLSVVFSASILLFINKKLKDAKRVAMLAKTPRLQLTGLSLSPIDVDMYVGDNVEWDNTKPIWGKDPATDEFYSYIDLVLNPNCLRKETLISHKGKKYLFINRCPQDAEKHKDNIVLAFDVLNMKIEFDSNRINTLKIKKSYAMISESEAFGSDVKIDVNFSIDKSSLEIPIAYACLISRNTSVNLYNINKLAKSGANAPIDFLQSKEKIKKYLNFTETAYLLECTTTDDEIHYYSMLLKVDEDKLVSNMIYNGQDWFYEKAKTASYRAGYNVIKQPVDL